ncbi:nicotinamide mononucleotide transporter [Desulfosediminicola sp.]|uniref:nicotinamide mononucleotide transporter n=1 Tax=Desulfosediminicola sp. TaxID=2886825 RepID=UPI003AF22C25
MDFALQMWGGLFYLSNKVFFALAEGKDPVRKRQLKIIGWSVYILGVPAWIIILLAKQNWIAASLELGGVPAMFLGLYCVWSKCRNAPVLFDRFAAFSTYFFLIFGTCYSIYDYGGLTSLSQFLEIIAATGFLLGSYLLAKNKLTGWIFFMLMNSSMAALMLVNAKYILAAQQGVSLCVVIYGFVTAITARDRIAATT